jgi:hypothetical protein
MYTEFQKHKLENMDNSLSLLSLLSHTVFRYISTRGSEVKLASLIPLDHSIETSVGRVNKDQ